jgi:heme exporter protein C
VETVIYRLFLFTAAIGATIAYALAPPAKNFLSPESARILFFHAPEAMLCTLFFFWGAVMAGRYLWSGRRGAANPSFDFRSNAAIEVGFILCLLATVTGSIFAYQQWGVAWDWDPRQLSIFVQLLIYGAYFALRGGFTSRERTAAYSGAYAIFAFLTVPFLIWILPRLPQIATKHGLANGAVVQGGLDPTYRIIFYSCSLVFLLVAAWCYKLRVRLSEEVARKEEALYASSVHAEPGSGDASGAGMVRPVRIRNRD